VQDLVARLRQEIVRGRGQEGNTAVVSQEPTVIGKELQMLKMGNRDEKDAGNDFRHGRENSSAGARSRSSEETVIGENISIEGTVLADEDIIIEGRMKGTIETKSHCITIGPKGHIEADVDAQDVVISGMMAGNIIARNKVQINKEADFTGRITAKRIAIEDGAYIKATIELEKEEKQKAQASEPTISEQSAEPQSAPEPSSMPPA
jgi:cytoskeletal protein CcmA (bactofilin family)